MVEERRRLRGRTYQFSLSSLALHVRKETCQDRPSFSHPPFDVENRIVITKDGDLTIASIYVPNWGQGFSSKNAFPTGVGIVRRGVSGDGRTSAPLRRLECCPRGDRRSSEGAKAPRNRPASRGARTFRTNPELRSGRPWPCL
jgi:hypothetical protein